MPFVSVIVPVFNTEAYLRECFDSLVSQTFSDIEIIAVNDGSTDGSEEIIAEYAAKYPDLFVPVKKENGGLSSARNSGIKVSRGKYLMFVDSDDRVLPEFVSAMVGGIGENDIAVCDFLYGYENKTVPAKIHSGLSEVPEREYIMSSPMACTRIIKRGFLEKEGFSEGILYEDLERMPRLALDTRKIAFVDRPLYFYRMRSGSIMKEPVFSEKQNDIFRVLDSVFNAFSEHGRLEEYKNEIEYLYIEHLLRSAALRFSAYGERKALFARIKREMDSKWRNWKKNPYFAKKSLKFRIIARLSYGGHCRIVKMISEAV